VRGLFLGKQLIFLLLMAPLLVPVVIVALCLYVAMADYGLLGSFAGLVIGHLLLAVPYALVVLLGAVRGLNRQLEYAAATLGASPWRVLRQIILPALAPGVASAWILAFLHSFDELLVTLFLLGRLPQTLPLKMWADIRMQFDPVISAASSSIITVVALAILIGQVRNLIAGTKGAR
jgi:putative spermidine/putrescine transport system permease protein